MIDKDDTLDVVELLQIETRCREVFNPFPFTLSEDPAAKGKNRKPP